MSLEGITSADDDQGGTTFENHSHRRRPPPLDLSFIISNYESLDIGLVVVERVKRLAAKAGKTEYHRLDQDNKSEARSQVVCTTQNCNWDPMEGCTSP